MVKRLQDSIYEMYSGITKLNNMLCRISYYDMHNTSERCIQGKVQIHVAVTFMGKAAIRSKSILISIQLPKPTNYNPDPKIYRVSTLRPKR